jgi:hypothetical protein
MGIICQEPPLEHKKRDNLLPESVDPLHTVSDRLPAFFAHERAVTEFQVGDFEPFSGNGVHVADDERLFSIAFHVDRNGLPAIMDGDLDHDILDSPCPEGRDLGRFCPVHTLLAAFNGSNFHTECIVTAFGDKVVFHVAFVFFGKLDTADTGSTFAGNDRFYHESLRFAFFGDSLVMTAGRAPDEQVAGLGDYFLLGFGFALGAGGGDKH